VFLRAEYPLTPNRSITNQFQALCTALFGVLFSFRSPYYCAIGLKTYLALEVGVSQISARYPTHGTQDEAPELSVLRLRGYHTLWRAFPGKFNFADKTVLSQAYNTTSPRRDSVWALPLSLAVTYGISI
jgi:hypothetical protein